MAISTNCTAHLADVYKQVGIGLSLYRSPREGSTGWALVVDVPE